MSILLAKETNIQEQDITKQFYKEYRTLRLSLLQHLIKENPDRNRHLILEKTQKILDRMIFICFCEDYNLIPQGTFQKVIQSAEHSFDVSPMRIWNQLKGLFHSIDKGNPPMDINKFSGGLFANDPQLDSLILHDEVVKQVLTLGTYDFESQLNVNILGHIFEQSISDLEELKGELDSEPVDIKSGKRKKDGIYYTPEYITRYMVEQAVGGWLEDRRKELGFYHLPVLTEKDYASIKTTSKGTFSANKNVKQHLAFWEQYKDKLSSMTVVDPACGSGAFLIQAFNYLYAEGQRVNKELADLRNEQTELFDLDKHILSNNLYGVDINRESVEITKLSLWLKTANKNKELTTLDKNILCGNSLIDDPEVVGDRAFSWEEGFPKIFEKGGFDVVIANPPYVGEKGNKDIFELIKKAEFGAKHYLGKMDLLYFFIHLALDITKENSILSFITTNYFVTATGGKKLRNDIKQRASILQIVNFNELRIFESALGQHNMITVLKKGVNPGLVGKTIVVNRTGIADTEVLDSILNLRDEKSRYSEIKQSDFYYGDNNYIATSRDKINGVFEKMIAKSTNLGSICNVNTGLFTAADRVFIIDKNDVEKVLGQLNSLERTLLKPLFKNSDISKYHCSNVSEKVVIYHHEKADYKKEDIPHIYFYLEKYKGILTKRKDNSLKGALKRGRWDVMALPKTAIDFTGEKIVAPQRSKQNTFGYNNISWYASADVYFITQKNEDFSLKYVLAILNSHLYYQWLYHKGKRKGETLELYQQPLSQVPIPSATPEQQKPLAQKAEKMMDLHKDKHEMVRKFLKLLTAEYGVEKPSKNIQKWYTLDWATFEKELGKAKVKMSLQQKSEWMDFFETEKAKVQVVQAEIEKTDQEIDTMVYELYGLTQEEIRVVEGTS